MQIFKYLIILALIYQPLIVKAEVINKIIVTVSDKIITQYDVETFNPKKLKSIYSIEDQEEREKVLNQYNKAITDVLVQQTTLEIAANRAGVKVSDEDAENALSNILEKNNLTRDQLEVLLLKDNLTLPKYLISIKKDIFQARLKNRVIMPMILVTQEDINHKVDEIANDRKLDDQLELRMITLDKNTPFKEVLGYLKKHSFSDAAIQYSADPTAKSAGYLGWIKMNSMSKYLQEASKDKGFGDVFTAEDEDGKKMVFKVEGVRDIYDIDSDLRVELVKQLQEEKFESAFKTWLEKSKKTIYINYVN